MTVHNIGVLAELRAWRQSLTPQTWQQRIPTIPGRRCAVCVCVPPSPDGSSMEWISDEAWSELSASIGGRSAIGPFDLADIVEQWNDAKGRTLEDVHSLFDRTIKRLEDAQDNEF